MAAPRPGISARRWPLLATVSVFVAFTLFHLLAYGSASGRYQKALANAQSVGLVLGPAGASHILPPRLSVLVAGNGMASAAAEQRGNSGALASDMLADVTALAASHGMDIVSTEPGSVDQKPSSIEIHAHFRFSCDFDQFIGFLDDVARGGHLLAVERFSLVARDQGPIELELWMSRLILKQGAIQK